MPLIAPLLCAMTVPRRAVDGRLSRPSVRRGGRRRRRCRGRAPRTERAPEASRRREGDAGVEAREDLLHRQRVEACRGGRTPCSLTRWLPGPTTLSPADLERLLQRPGEVRTHDVAQTGRGNRPGRPAQRQRRAGDLRPRPARPGRPRGRLDAGVRRRAAARRLVHRPDHQGPGGRRSEQARHACPVCGRASSQPALPAQTSIRSRCGPTIAPNPPDLLQRRRRHGGRAAAARLRDGLVETIVTGTTSCDPPAARPGARSCSARKPAGARPAAAACTS